MDQEVADAVQAISLVLTSLCGALALENSSAMALARANVERILHKAETTVRLHQDSELSPRAIEIARMMLSNPLGEFPLGPAVE